MCRKFKKIKGSGSSSACNTLNIVFSRILKSEALVYNSYLNSQNSRFTEIILFINILDSLTVLFLTNLPIHQDCIENRYKVYSTDLNNPIPHPHSLASFRSTQ